MKRKGLLMLIGSVCLALMLALPLVASCGPATPEEAAEEIAALESEIDELEGEVAAKGAEISDLEAEIAGLTKPTTFEWRLQSCFCPGDHEPEIGIPTFVDFVEKETDGRLTIEFFYDGEIYAGEETLTSLGEGLTEMAGIDPTYLSGIEPACDIWGGPPFSNLISPTYGDTYALQTMSGLSELWRDFVGGYNNRIVGTHTYGPYPLMCSNVPIRSNADWAGVKVRSYGCYAMLFEELGASTVWIPGADQYEALLLGTINVATWAFEAVEDMHWNEVMDYLILPGWCSEVGVTLVNNDAWETLPTDIQDIITLGQREYARESIDWYNACYQRVQDRADEWGYEVIILSDADIDEMRQLTYDEVWPDMAALSPLSAEAIEIIKDWYGLE